MSFLDPEYLLRVFLVFSRIGGLLVSAPVFGHQSIPARVKILFSVLFAYALAGLPADTLPPYATTTFGLILATAIEILTGLTLGLAAQLVFWIVQFAGEILGFQMGLSMAQVLDPANGQPSNPLGRLLGMTFLMVFILLEGHHHVLQALVVSFEVVPLAGARLATSGPLFLDWMGSFLLMALRLASPFMVTIFLVDTALGVFARIAPQADLFSIGLPLKLLVGTGMFYFFLQNFVPFAPDLVTLMMDHLLTIIEVLVPS